MVSILDKHAKYEILEAIRKAELSTSGEIRVHVRPKCGEDPMKEARKLFHRLKMDRTRHRNGVLIFVAWKSRRFAILGDEGIHIKVGEDFWKNARDVMQETFLRGDVVGGIVAGVRQVGEKLKSHFPEDADNPDELPNEVSED
jgi:uncharacterized membrane protein